MESAVIPRARTIGITFQGITGKENAITDVPGVEVGYRTLIIGDSVRMGVSAILPRGREKVGLACAAGIHSFNGNGEYEFKTAQVFCLSSVIPSANNDFTHTTSLYQTFSLTLSNDDLDSIKDIRVELSP